MNISRIIKTFFLLLLSAPFYAQQNEEIIKTGNDLYKKGEYEKAAQEYQKVSYDQRAKFNYGNALYKQNKKDDAVKVFNVLSIPANKPDLRALSYYNTGVVYTSKQQLEESIEAYKNTLRLNPDDKQARENLQKALLELKRKTPPKKEEKKNTPQKKPPPRPKMNPKQAEQKLKQLQQKEKETQQRVQKKSPSGPLQIKDW